jgi:hypothetical protein
MPLDHLDFTENLLNLAAVIYRPEDDVDALLLSFARSLQREGRRLGGVVQRNWRNECGPARLMAVVDLMTERQIPICQDLGSGSGACQLDEASLADAAQAVRRAVASDVELVIVNKFGKTAWLTQRNRRGHSCKQAGADRRLHAHLPRLAELHGQLWHNADL